jgi:exopolysaccharide biosynthesis polyprenyl glycosylphosphotransferase
LSLDQVIAKAPAGLAQADEFIAAPRRSSRRYNQQLICESLAAFEILLVAALCFGALSNPEQIAAPGLKFPLAAAIAVAVTAFATGFATGAHSFDGFGSRKALLPGAILASLMTAMAAWLSDANGLYILLCAATLFAGIYIARVPSIIAKLTMEAMGRLSRMVGVVGDNPAERRALLTALLERSDIEVVFSGSFEVSDVLHQLCRQGQLDEVVLAGAQTNPAAEAELAGLAVTLIRMLPQDLTLAGACNRRTDWNNAWNGPASVIARPPLRTWGGVFKRVLDIVGAAVGLFLLSPLLIVIAIAVKLDSPGPIFFVQERAGYRTRPFRMLKFRSMQHGQADALGSQLTLRNDPRVTRVGSFIRRTSIDELPQLINVLKGDMSLVGPRPHVRGAKAGGRLYDELIPTYYSRYRVKPGVTGLAQIAGFRGNTETEQSLIDRFESDLRYVAEWHLGLDISILMRTIPHLLEAKNAF